MSTTTSILVAFVCGYLLAQLSKTRRRKGLMNLPESTVLAKAVDRLWQMKQDCTLSDEEFLQKKSVIFGSAKDGEDRLIDGVILISGVKNKIKAIKAVRSLCPQLGLYEAKYAIEHLPQVFTTEQTEAVQQRLTAADLTVQVV